MNEAEAKILSLFTEEMDKQRNESNKEQIENYISNYLYI
jgi:hypothetical protein